MQISAPAIKLPTPIVAPIAEETTANEAVLARESEMTELKKTDTIEKIETTPYEQDSTKLGHYH